MPNQLREDRQSLRQRFTGERIPRELTGEPDRVVGVTRQEETPGAADFLPARYLVDGLMLRVLRRQLDRVSDAVMNALADFQNAVGAPLVDQPVETAEFAAADLDLGQWSAIAAKAAEPELFAFLNAIVQRDLADDVREENTILTFLL